MNDDEVLDAVKNTLSGVQMDRPIGAIERRGQALRRNRRLLGVAAGGGLAAVAALAVALPMASHPSGTIQAGGSTTGTAATMQPVAFTVTKQSDSTVKLTLNFRQVFDPDALQQALADAGIPAVVKTGVDCTPQGKELPEADQVYRFEQVTSPDEAFNGYVLVITPSKMPKRSRLYFSISTTDRGGEHAKAKKSALFLVSNDDPMNCRSIG